MPVMATAGEDRNSASEHGCPVERALIANEMMVYSEQDKVLITSGCGGFACNH